MLQKEKEFKAKFSQKKNEKKPVFEERLQKHFVYFINYI